MPMWSSRLKSHFRANRHARRIRNSTRMFLDSFFVSGNYIKLIVKKHPIDLVLDVGANVGQFGIDLRNAGFTSKIVSFEPSLEAFCQLRENVKFFQPWDIINVALGQKDSKAELNLAENDGLSNSFLSMNELHNSIYPGSDFIATEIVQLLRLDSFDFPEKSILLKLDVQGFELEVLKGSLGILPKIRYVLLEISLVSLYTGQPTLLELLTFLDLHGYEVTEFFNFQRSRGRLIQFDLLVSRKSSD